MESVANSENTSNTNTVGEISVNWQNAPSLSELESDYRSAQEHQQVQLTKINTWLDNLNVEGKAKVKTANNRSSVVPKLIRKQAEWRYAALSEPFLSTDNLFDADPATWEDKESAKQNSLLLNHQFRADIKKNAFIDEYIRAAVEEGTVIIRTGWKFEKDTVQEEVPLFNVIVDPSFQPTLDEVLELKSSNPNKFHTDVPYELKAALEASIEAGASLRPILNGKTKIVDKEVIIENGPTVEICNINNVLIDPTCLGDIDKANFVIYEFESSYAELKKDERYKNLENIINEDNDFISEPDFDSSTGVSDFNFKDKARRKFVVKEYWGFWDINGNKKLEPIVIAWVGKTIVRMGKNPFPDKKVPFTVVSYLPVRKSIYGEPDGALLDDNQQIIGAVTRGMIDLMGRSANSQTGIAQGFLDATNQNKFERGADYKFNPSIPPSAGLHMHEYPDIPQSALDMIQIQNQEAESLTGVKAFAGGLSGEALGDVATAVRGVLDASSKRELGILRRISTGIIEIGKKITAMNGEFLSETEVIRITNDEFVQVRRHELAGRFDIKLTISTAEEDNAKAEELGFLLQTLGNTMDIGITKIILNEVATLRKMPHLAKAISEFEPQPDPVQLEIQKLEIEKLKAEIAEIQSKVSENTAEAQLDQAKIGTEQAKAAQLAALTNRSALDFVETETGTTHEREMEKQKAQARGNIELEMVKNKLNTSSEQQKHKNKMEDALIKDYVDSRKERRNKTVN